MAELMTMRNRKVVNIGDGVDVKRCETVVSCVYLYKLVLHICQTRECCDRQYRFTVA